MLASLFSWQLKRDVGVFVPGMGKLAVFVCAVGPIREAAGRSGVYSLENTRLANTTTVRRRVHVFNQNAEAGGTREQAQAN